MKKSQLKLKLTDRLSIKYIPIMLQLSIKLLFRLLV